MERNYIEPRTGMKVTCLLYSDRVPGTILDVGKDWVSYRLNKCKRSGQATDNLEWEITDELFGEVRYAKRRKDKWYTAMVSEKGNIVFDGCPTLVVLDKWMKYYDLSF